MPRGDFVSVLGRVVRDGEEYTHNTGKLGIMFLGNLLEHGGRLEVVLGRAAPGSVAAFGVVLFVFELLCCFQVALA